MIEAGWPSAEVKQFSIGKLNWVHNRREADKARQNLMQLHIAAAGANGGEAYKEMFQKLQDEIERLDGRSNANAQTSSMPLNQQDFELMLKHG